MRQKKAGKEEDDDMSIKNWLIFLLLAPLAGLLQGMRRD